MRIFAALLNTELKLFRRDKMGLVSIFFFTALVSLLLFFGLGSFEIDTSVVVPNIIWLATLFGGTLQLNRTFDYEREGSVLEGLKMVPDVMGSVYLSKFTINTAVLILIMFFATLFTCVLFNYSDDFSFLLPIALGAISMSAVGTTFSSMVMGHHKKDVMLPALLYPLLVPIVIAVIMAIDTTAAVPLPWLKIIIAFNVLYITASYLIFESIMEE